MRCHAIGAMEEAFSARLTIRHRCENGLTVTGIPTAHGAKRAFDAGHL